MSSVSLSARPQRWLAALGLLLSGCTVAVSPISYDTQSPAQISDFATATLLEAVLVPLGLAAESPAMVIQPEAYLSPASRARAAVHVIETSYGYLFDSSACALGGYTQTEAEAQTTDYSDGYRLVDLWLNAAAYDCQTTAAVGDFRTTSDVRFTVSGWFDDWANQLYSMDAKVSGEVAVNSPNWEVQHRNMIANVTALSPWLISITAESDLTLKDFWDRLDAELSTLSDIGFALGASHPRSGAVKLRANGSWVILSFEDEGLWRTDSKQQQSYWRWSELYQ